ncbi:polysaccharide biosynthesis/export family protein [Spirochaeta lutea]|nr:SLBB domain-containing protein [Spirochaeta lutea]
MKMTRFLVFGGILMLLLSSLHLGAQADSDAQSAFSAAVERRIMHIQDFEPVPGDIYRLLIDFGSSIGEASNSSAYDLILQEDHTLKLPFIGTMNVQGRSFSDIRSRIITQIEQKVPAVHVDFALRAPALFEVFVFGAVSQSGLIPASSLTRVNEVLQRAGLIPGTSSTRTLELQRNGQKQTLDLFQFSEYARRNQNPFLRPGDQIFVRRAEHQISITGEIAVPGQMEFVPGETLAQIIRYAGGLKPTADTGYITRKRLTPQGTYEIQRIENPDLEDIDLQNGDQIIIPSTAGDSAPVIVHGAVAGKEASGSDLRSLSSTSLALEVSYRPGMSLLTALELVGGPTVFADYERAYYISGDDKTRQPLTDLREIWETRDSSRDFQLHPGDTLVIPMKVLRVFVTGETVLTTGGGRESFQWIEGFTVRDYLDFAGGVNPETGNRNNVGFLQPDGSVERVNLETSVPPGAIIFVQKNGWENFKNFMASDIMTTIGWITTILSATALVINTIDLIIN